ncbi:MAG TPA: hypothetical protein VH852_05850 [Hyphomicrobium sp.]|jgi:hypothetical protein
MMRIIGRLLVVAAALGLLTSGAMARVAFEDNKLNFKSCDGKNLTARWRDNNFHLSVPGRTLEPAAPELKYLGWDGTCRSLSVDTKGRFMHKGAGADDANHVINYLSWDDTKWSATRAGTGFFMVFVAGKNEPTSQAQLRDAALWLEMHKADSRAAIRLARELSASAAK